MQRADGMVLSPARSVQVATWTSGTVPTAMSGSVHSIVVSAS